MLIFEEIESLPELLKNLKNEGIPIEEYRGYVNQFLSNKARRDLIPISGLFELTPLCNLDCKMCYVHLSEQQFRDYDLLPISVWKDLMTQAIDAGMMRATLTGGECLTYPGFDELYLFLLSQGVKVSINTNGLLLDSKRIAFFVANPPEEIQISLYGSTEEDYESVTGRRVFSVVMNSIKNAKEAGLGVRVAITPSEFMKDAKNIVDLLRREDIRFFINANLFDPRYETGKSGETIDMPIEGYIDLYRHVYGSQEKCIIGEECVAGEADITKKRDTNIGLRCGAGRYAFDIDWKGRMLACVNLKGIVAYPLENGFVDSWRSINERVKNYVLPFECDTCKYYNKCRHCVANHCKAPVGHVDKHYCNRIKHLCDAGLL